MSAEVRPRPGPASAGMKKPLRILLAVAVIIVAALVALVVVIKVRNAEQPPAPQASAGVYRLTPSRADLPEVPTRVAIPGGARYLFYGGVTDGGQAARITVASRQGDPHPAQVTLAAGQTRTANGLSLRVVHVWNMPNAAHDAIDVHAVAAS